MKIIIEYIICLLKKWVFYLSVPPTIYSLISTYTKFKLIEIPDVFLYMAGAVFFLIASYQVWVDERDKVNDLKNQLNNPADYKVTVLLKKVVLDEVFIKKQIDNKIKEVSGLLKKARKELEKYSNENSYGRYMASGLNFGNKQDSKEISSKIESYINKLEKYIDQKDSCIVAWQEYYDENFNELYEAHFKIKNTGFIFDEDISVKIQLENNKIVMCEDLLDNLPACISLPEKPDYRPVASVINNSFNNYLPLFDFPDSYYLNKKITENLIQVTLRDLKADQEVFLLDEERIYLMKDSFKNIYFSVMSKNTSKKLNKKVAFIDNGEISLNESLFE